MNGKQARNLRKLVTAALPNLPKVKYEAINEHDKLFQAGFNADGTVRRIPVPVSTIVLTGCQRQSYQRAKTLHNLYHGR